MVYLLSTSCVLTLAYSTLFPLVLLGDTLLLLSSCRCEGVNPELPGVRGLLGIRLTVDVPVVPSFDESFSYMFLRFRYIRHFVIHVINNIRTRFIISFTWYVLWYTIHSIVYMCDLILAHIWLLGLCPFINRVLHLSLQSLQLVFHTCYRSIDAKPCLDLLHLATRLHVMYHMQWVPSSHYMSIASTLGHFSSMAHVTHTNVFVWTNHLYIST